MPIRITTAASATSSSVWTISRSRTSPNRSRFEPRAEFRYERRGTIYFRKKELDRALADYEQALVINPQYAPALYARGIVKLKKGDLAGGGADIAAAKYIRQTIDAEMARAGVK